jgi:hypothetical protein
MTTSTRRARPATTTAARTTTTERTTPTRAAKAPTIEPSARAVAEELLVQTDLAGMEARDQWQRLATEIERRRSAADVAVRHLLDGGSEASKTFAAGVRDAVDELRAAVETAIKTLR